MSIPKKRLHELINELNDQDAKNLVDITEALILKRNKETSEVQEFDPEKFRGILKPLNIDVEKECRKLREQWNRNI